MIDRDFMPLVIERVKEKQQELYHWLDLYEDTKELPLYSSVDIRDAGFKAAIVDTNLFPGGFNNVCEHGLADSVGLMKKAILKRVPKCQNVIIVAEEHTRNTWYLENIRILEDIIQKGGFDVKIATFLAIQPAFCEQAKAVELETATGATVKVNCFKNLVSQYQKGAQKIDLIILNNDLTSGIPDALKESKIPIYPSIQAGWHSRLKSFHFAHTEDLVEEFGRILGLDPWLFSTIYKSEDQININSDEDRKRLAKSAASLFTSIEKKYKEHQISAKPYIVLKADAGTYGMGVIPVEDPEDIVKFNRKDRNNLYKGKSSKLIERFLLQEGVPTIYSIDQKVSEVVLYQIENTLIGGFYRSNSQKSDRENLNSQGMAFNKMCPHSSKYGECGVHHDINIFDVYRILGRIAAIAAHREIVQLEATRK